MPKDKTKNHEKIVIAAYDEFLKYGFIDASIRRIAAASGMSAAGLYKHFTNKEDMFGALVEPAFKGLKKAYIMMANEEMDSIDVCFKNKPWNYNGEIVCIMRYIYENYKAFKLLVCKSQGTRYENFVHELTLLEEESTRRYMQKLNEIGVKMNLLSVEEYHIILSTIINAIFLAVKNDLTKEEALSYAKHLEEFLMQAGNSCFTYI